MLTASENATFEPTRLKGSHQRVIAAILWSFSASVSATYLGDPYVPDPSGTINGADTAGNVWLGITSASSTLAVLGGGSLSLDAGKSFYVGIDTGSNAASVTGASNVLQANLTVPKDIYVGLNDISDNNSMTVGDWGNVIADRLILGMNDNSSGNTFTANGANGTLQITGDVYVGFSGDSNQIIIDQGRDISVGGHVYLGVEASSSGNTLRVTGSGSSLVSVQEMLIGFGGGLNTLLVEKGGQVTNRHTYMGFYSGADGNQATVSGAGSLWRTNGVFYFGFASDNNQVTVNTDGQVIVGTGTGVPNTFTVNPDGALRISAGRLATVVGGYLQQSAGTFHLDATSPSNHGRLAVTGNVTLEQDAHIVVTAANCPAIPVGSTISSVISATSSLSRGRIIVSDNCPEVDFRAVQNGNAIDLQTILPTPIPTLSTWGMVLLAGLLGFSSLFSLSGKRVG